MQYDEAKNCCDIMRLLTYLALGLLSPTTLASVDATFTFSLDNDGIFGVDQDYTNGIFLSYTTPALSREGQYAWMSLSEKYASSIDKFEWLIGHKMWTPSDIGATEPIANDRPYAGFFHTEINYLSLNPQQSVRYNLTLGTTGEHALSEKAQRLVHSITGSTEPKGWEYQVDNQFTVGVGYKRFDNLHREVHRDSKEWEISNLVEVNASTFRSDVSAGVMFRYGSELSQSMGAADISVERPFNASMMGNTSSGWFLFSGITGRYRFNDLSIEGERSGIPEPSEAYDVTLQHWQSTAVAGIAMYNRTLGFSFTLAVKTPDYIESPHTIYGNGALSMYAFF